MKKGFTLMEVLAVLLLLALIASLAVPMFRSVRMDMRYRRARASALLMAEAVKQVYAKNQRSIPGSFTPTTTNITTASGAYTCGENSSTGIPRRSMSGASTSSLDILNLFGCGYLSPKDFKGLPYKFETSSLTCSSSNGCLVKVTGTTDAGSKYANACFWVDQAGDVHVPESTDAVCQ